MYHRFLTTALKSDLLYIPKLPSLNSLSQRKPGMLAPMNRYCGPEGQDKQLAHNLRKSASSADCSFRLSPATKFLCYCELVARPRFVGAVQHASIDRETNPPAAGAIAVVQRSEAHGCSDGGKSVFLSSRVSSLDEAGVEPAPNPLRAYLAVIPRARRARRISVLTSVCCQWRDSSLCSERQQTTLVFCERRCE